MVGTAVINARMAGVTKPLVLLRGSSPEDLTKVVEQLFPRQMTSNSYVCALKESSTGDEFEANMILSNPAIFDGREFDIVLGAKYSNSNDNEYENYIDRGEALNIIDLTNEGDQLHIFADTVSVLRFAVRNSAFSSVSLDEILHVLEKVAVDGRLNRQSIMTLSKAFSSSSNLTAFMSDEQQEANSIESNREVEYVVYRLLCDAFDLLDRNMSGFVTLEESAAMFSVLSPESKSEKLLFVFDLFDNEGVGSLDRAQAHRYLRSFLCAVMGYNDEGSEKSKYILIDATVGSLVDDIFPEKQVEAESPGLSRADRVTFDDFAEWYAMQGSTRALWIELLDMKKWPSTPNEKGFVFLLNGKENFSYSLTVSLVDAERARRLTQVTGLGNMTAEDAQRIVIESADDEGRISRKNFRDVVRQLVPSGELMSEELQREISGSLLTIFQSFDRSAKGLIPAEDLASGLSIFCGGPKSDKLAASFELYADHDDTNNGEGGESSDDMGLNFMTNSENLFRFFRSFLTVILSLTEQCTELSKDMAFTLIDKVCQESSDLVFANLQRSGATLRSDLISFADFANFYNSNGHEKLQWLELLDIRKWPRLQQSQETAESLMASSPRRSQLLKEQKKLTGISSSSTMSLKGPPSIVLTEKSQVVFAVPFETDTSSNANLYVSTLDVNRLRIFLSVITRNKCEPRKLLQVFGPVAKPPLLYEQNITERSSHTVDAKLACALCTEELVRIDLLTSSAAGEVGVLLSNIFSMLSAKIENEDALSVEVRELAIGFGMFAEGSKSEKLATAFEFVSRTGVDMGATTNDGDCTLSREDLTILLRSFLSVIVGLNCSASSQFDRAWLDGVARRGCNVVFSSAKRKQEDNITFAEFGNFYNGGGYKTLSWLELLDLQKWPTLLEGGSSDNQTNKNSSTSNLDVKTLENKTVFTFQLNSDSAMLEFFGDDVEKVSWIRKKMRFHDFSAEEMLNELETFCSDGFMNEHNARMFCDSMVRDNVSEEDTDFLRLVFGNIFDALCLENDSSALSPSVSLHEFAAVLSVFNNGDKSSKLQVAFQAADDDGDGYIDEFQFFSFLRSFLIVLCGLSKKSATHQADGSLGNVIAKTIEEATTDVFRGLSREGLLSFEEFAEWYSRSGFKKVPWIELLDQKKFKMTSTDEDDEEEEYSSESSSDEEVLRNLNGVRLQFELNVQRRDVLEYTKQDLTSLRRLQSLSQFERFDSSILLDELRNEAYKPIPDESDDDDSDYDPTDEVVTECNNELVLNKAGFDRCIRNAIPRDSLTIDERRFLSEALSTVFYAFDRNNDDKVSCSEFMTGFSLLTSGDKSSKLARAFELMDSDNNGKLMRSEVYSYLRSFLTMLCALNRRCNETPRDILDQMIDVATGEATELIFTEAVGDKASYISFEEFAAWYNHGGFQRVPWLELLDLRKWEPKDEELVFFLESNEEGYNLIFDNNDIYRLLEVQELAKLDRYEPEDLLQMFDDEADYMESDISDSDSESDSTDDDDDDDSHELVLNKTGFDQFLERVIDLEALSLKDEKIAKDMFSNIFYAFDRNEDDEVSFIELAIGLLILTKGSKSEKLAVAFDLIDHDDNGLMQSELYTFLRSFLTMLCALNHRYSTTLSTVVHQIVDITAGEVAEQIFNGCVKAPGRIENSSPMHIRFEEFGQFYNNGGYTMFSWLELLDLRKWGGDGEIEIEKRKEYEEDVKDNASWNVDEGPNWEDEETLNWNGWNVEEDDFVINGNANGWNDVNGTSSEENSRNDTVFSFQCVDDFVLEFTKGDVDNLQDFQRVSNLHTCETVDLFTVILQEANEEDVITLSQFYDALEYLIDFSSLSSGVRKFLFERFSHMFSYFDLLGDNSVDAKSLACGLSLLCGGKKSGKIALAFDLMDRDGDGYLNRSECYNYLRSFFAMICALNSGCGRMSFSNVSQVIDITVGYLVNVVFEEGDINFDHVISFEEFSNFYTDGGFRELPWLELLDQSKWEKKGVLSDDATIPPKNHLNGALPIDRTEDNEDTDGMMMQLCSIEGDEDLIEVYQSHLDVLRYVLDISGLGNLSASRIASEIYRDSDRGQWLTKRQFDESIDRLLFSEETSFLSKRQYQFVSAVLSNIFFSFCRDDEYPRAMADELASAFAMIGNSNLREQMLAAWTLFIDFDEGDSGSGMSFERFTCFVRSGFTLLAALTHEDQQYLSAVEEAVVNEASQARSEEVFAALDLDTMTDLITFKRFMRFLEITGQHRTPFAVVAEIAK
eukprot:g2801.t1